MDGSIVVNGESSEIQTRFLWKIHQNSWLSGACHSITASSARNFLVSFFFNSGFGVLGDVDTSIGSDHSNDPLLDYEHNPI